jgi:hypothetical protein
VSTVRTVVRVAISLLAVALMLVGVALYIGGSP